MLSTWFCSAFLFVALVEVSAYLSWLCVFDFAGDRGVLNSWLVGGFLDCLHNLLTGKPYEIV